MNAKNEIPDEIASHFGNLLYFRRQKFRYCDKENGKFKGNGMVFLISLANTMIIPLLFFICVNILDLYSNFGLTMSTIVWPLLVSICITLFWTPLVGCLYGTFTHPSIYLFNSDNLEKKRAEWIKGLFMVLSTIGLIMCCAFLFRQVGTATSAAQQFESIIIIFSLVFPLVTIPTVKHSTYYTPSQDDRRKLIYTEALIYIVIAFLFASLPYWIKLGTDTCNCTAQCANGDSPACTLCYEECDSFTGENYYFISLLIMVCLFGLLSLMQICIRFRKFEESLLTSINSRFQDLRRNGFLLKTIILIFFEYVVFFSLTFWFSYYVFYELRPEDFCTTNFLYYCTRGFWFEWSILILLVVTGIITTVSRNYSYMSGIWLWFTLLLIFDGIYMAIFTKPQDWKSYLFIFFIGTIYLATLPTTKAIFTNAIYYDEYLTGNPQPNFGSSLYIGAVATAFFVSLALEFSLFGSNFNGDASFYANTINNYNDLGTGIILGVLGLVIMIMKYTYKNYELAHFDKTHIAIERNNFDITKNPNIVIDKYSFYDPIKKAIIKMGFKPKNQVEQRLFYLFNTLNESEFENAKKMKFDKISYDNYLKILFGLLMLVPVILILGLLHKAVITIYAWAFLPCFILLAIIPLAMILHFNSARAAKRLKSYDSEEIANFLNRYIIWREAFSKNNEQTQKLNMIFCQCFKSFIFL